MTEPNLAAPPTPAWAEHLVRLLDDRFSVPGTRLRFGLDGLLGLVIPGGGDALGALATLALFGLALQKQVPREVLMRMAINVAIDAGVGAVPIVGDLFDLGFKANRKNLALIEKSSALSGPQAGAPSGAPLPMKPPVRWQDRAFVFGVLFFVVCALVLPLVLLGLLIGYLVK